MGRDKEFDPDEALNKAVCLFWEKGYLDTSMDDVVRSTGVSRYGLYNVFGSKHALFVKALERYTELVVTDALSRLESPDSTVDDVRGFFFDMLSMIREGRGKDGCLICNSANEVAPFDDEVAERVRIHFGRQKAAFMGALKRSHARGDLDPKADVEALADYLVGVAQGLSTYTRSRSEPKMIERYLTVALQQIG